jgi:hypothetical protein
VATIDVLFGEKAAHLYGKKAAPGVFIVSAQPRHPERPRR